MKQVLTSLLCGGLLVAFTAEGALAQATAQINGNVKDQSGAVLPGVEVTVTQTDTGVKRSVPTDETGLYVLSSLPLGPYRLEAGLPGFRTYVQTGIVLQVNSSPVINPAMDVGQVTEQVEVQANAAVVERESSRSETAEPIRLKLISSFSSWVVGRRDGVLRILKPSLACCQFPGNGFARSFAKRRS